MSITTWSAGKAELGTEKQIGHGLRIVDRALKIVESAQFAAAVSAAGGMLRLRSCGLVGVDADE